MKILAYAFLVLCFQLALKSNGDSTEINLSEYDQVTCMKVDEADIGHASLGSKKCMKELGCFEITKDFICLIKRPLNFLPSNREKISTKFTLFTKEHPDAHSLVLSDPDSITKSPLDPTHTTGVLVHGFSINVQYGEWMTTVKDDLLKHTDYNVIIVDWGGGNGAPYAQATANTRVVGAEIALMIKALKKYKGVDTMKCHIIGHSLGAHIAGYAGERINKLGRITGLDPAKPYFEKMPAAVRLDPTDADFVDAIHTDTSSKLFLSFGLSQTVGHVDFYPNNGMNQPGCSNSTIHSVFIDGLFDVASRIVSCNHQRSTELFSSSITSQQALPVAYKCQDYQSYIDGKCTECKANNENCAVMGINADQYKPHKNDSKEVKMYLSTSDDYPFWEYTYQIQIKLRQTPEVDEQGKILLKIQGKNNSFEITLVPKHENIAHGGLYTFLMRSMQTFEDIQNIDFGWSSSSWRVLKSHAISPEYVKILPMSFGNQTIQRQQTQIFCYQVERSILSKHSSVLHQCPTHLQ